MERYEIRSALKVDRKMAITCSEVQNKSQALATAGM